MEIVRISTAKLHNNTGQVEGLPANPRQWTKAEVDRLARSLTETPELFEARPCLVYPIDKGYIVLGGNMRLAAAKQNEEKEVPCIVFPKETDADKLREIVIKDNGAFGEWDFDSLANDWDDLPLTDWGVPAWNAPDGTRAGDEPSDGGQQAFNYEQRYGVIVTCKDEAEQQKVFERLTGEGFECKVVCV